MTDALVPALVQTFAIILLGYGCGLFCVLSPEQASGVGKFVATVSLPGLLFRSMVKLDLHAVDWRFVVGIFVSKTIVFAITAVGTHLYERRCRKRIAFAGINAIFCTQSNDLAFGLPIVAALFGAEHPEYPAYLFMVAPISLMILNPIAFAMMAYGSSNTRVSDKAASPKPVPPASVAAPHGSDAPPPHAIAAAHGAAFPADVVPADEQPHDPRQLSVAASATPSTLSFWAAVLWRVLCNPVVSLVILGAARAGAPPPRTPGLMPPPPLLRRPRSQGSCATWPRPPASPPSWTRRWPPSGPRLPLPPSFPSAFPWCGRGARPGPHPSSPGKGGGVGSAASAKR